MKKFILILGILAITSITFADVYVVYDKSEKEVKSISAQDDAVVGASLEKYILPGELEDYPLIYDARYYKFNGNKFIVNTKKISDEELEKDKNKDKKDEMDLIINKIYKDACEELEASGTVFKEIKCSSF